MTIDGVDLSASSGVSASSPSARISSIIQKTDDDKDGDVMMVTRTTRALLGAMGVGALVLTSCAVAEDSEGEVDETPAAPDEGGQDEDDQTEDDADVEEPEDGEDDAPVDEHLDGELSGDRVDPDAFEVPPDEQSQATGARAWQFETPSGRHMCSLGRSGEAATPAVVCSMAFDEDAEPEPDDQGRDRHPTLLETEAGLFGYDGPVYPEFEPSEVPTLDYGEVLEVEGISCTVDEEAITCVAGDHWMQVSRGGYEFSSDDEAQEAEEAEEADAADV
ncbi:hypothetical protein [Nesterenkonia xinjiangensis]|uniref:Uncharacterized protein n=1 Tax=Nesterenkonia xinjiangensis TaxID=225327 RepID=A0A7Z0K952_9MICC|nr:hypothetical protein [Nesterenkonia xinjiangensis]NYJ77418.1 hypothetical protein [Nesterenkonia xinjiangensis]